MAVLNKDGLEYFWSKIKAYISTQLKTGLYEANLQWGGKNYTASYAPIDAAMVPTLGANRLAIPSSLGDAVTIEYSRDGGATWSNYDTINKYKAGLFNGNTGDYYIGATDAANIDKSKYMLRVTMETKAAHVYTALNKFVIYVSTRGSTNCYCTISARTRTNYENKTDSWKIFADKVPIAGWSGFNVINTADITTYGNTMYQYTELRFTFGVGSHPSTVNYGGLCVNKIMGFGGVGWTTPSTLASSGRVYTYDNDFNVSFPGAVSATKFNGSLSWNNVTDKPTLLKGDKGDKGDTGATGATGATGPAGKDGVNGTTPTIKASAGTNIGSVGTPSVTASTSGTTTTFTFNYLKGAKGDPGTNGTNGKDGTNGTTPTIGSNGNWFIGSTDTGKPSRGATGATGPQGPSATANVKRFTSSIAGIGWSGSEPPYTMTISVKGILATDDAIVSPVLSDNWYTAQSQSANWDRIRRIVTANDSITVYAEARTDIMIPIQIKVVR